MEPQTQQSSSGKRSVTSWLVTIAVLTMAVFLVISSSAGGTDNLASKSDYWNQTAASGKIVDTSSLINVASSTSPAENSVQEAEPAATTETIEPPAPAVAARSYLVADISTGEVLAEKQADTARPIASISKLMTAVIADEVVARNDLVGISENAINTYGFAGGLAVGERLPLQTLYYPLILESSNDAATAIAEHYGFSEFMQLMNRKAWALDMSNTHFTDPSGLSFQNTASARDIFRLARYIYEKKPTILELTTANQKRILIEPGDKYRIFSNNNPMLGQIGFVGGKNGFTDEARHTLLSVFEIETSQGPRTVVIVILGSESHTDDTLRLRDWVNRAM